MKRRGAIGDVIMTTGVVRQMKELYGDNIQIVVATDCFAVYKNNPYVDAVIPWEAADANKFTLFMDLDDAYEFETNVNYLDAYFMVGFNSTQTQKHVELFPDELDQKTIKDIQKEHELDKHKYIVVHMRNWHWQAKNISMTVWFDIFTKLFEKNDNFKIVTVGGATDHTVEHPNFIDLRDKLNAQQTKLLCDDAKCFVGIDSAPYWCAAASSTTLIPLLTHLLPERIYPYRNCDETYNMVDYKFIPITTLEDCKGCNDRQQRPVRQIVCEKGNYPCTSNFDTNNIAEEILKVLE